MFCGLYGTFRRLLARVNVQGLQRITQIVRCAPTFDSLAQHINRTSELGQILGFVGLALCLPLAWVSSACIVGGSVSAAIQHLSVVHKINVCRR